MRQVLFHIPIYLFDGMPDGIPIYGYGAMLFVAFVACTILASFLARREGIAPQHVQDMAIWVFVFGILGARITYMIQYQVPVAEFYKIWDGGLVFYGSAIGGLLGYALAYHFVLRKYQISTWKMADVVAPCAALGLALGRVGCFLNGCCYGNVACESCPAVHFPLSAPARVALVERGFQTPAGFTLAEDVGQVKVDRVEPGSAAYENGLRDGDEILQADGHPLHHAQDLRNYLRWEWPRGKVDLQLTVRHADGQVQTLPAYEPTTLGLHPTQLYETISMMLLFFLLLAYYPFRRHAGEVMVLFMGCYAIHRFLNEILRKDTDPVAFGMTLSQNGSILVFLAALALGWWLWRKPVEFPSPGATAG